MTSVTAKEARGNFSDVVNRVAYGKERIMLTRHGAEIVAMVPIEDVQLIEDLEDYTDLKEACAALAESKKKGSAAWEKVKADLGL